MQNSKPALFSPGPGKRGMTELHYAAYSGDSDALLHFLEAGLAVNATDTYRGYTATHWLADMAALGGPRIEMLKALVFHGADINIKTPVGTTALMLARKAGTTGGDELAAELVALGAIDNCPITLWKSGQSQPLFSLTASFPSTCGRISIQPSFASTVLFETAWATTLAPAN